MMQLNKLTLIGLLVAGGLGFSCKSGQKATAMPFSALDGTWNVVELNGKTVSPELSKQQLILDLPQQTLSGNAGCNRMRGQIEYNEERPSIIKFSEVVTTRMACPALENELALLNAFGEVVRYNAEPA